MDDCRPNESYGTISYTCNCNTLMFKTDKYLQISKKLNKYRQINNSTKLQLKLHTLKRLLKRMILFMLPEKCCLQKKNLNTGSETVVGRR